jgi:hypothetical protein
MPPAWPEDDYLMQLGKVVYAIASIEGLLILDLPRMENSVAGLSVEELAGKTTTEIGKRLVDLAPSIGEQGWRAYLTRGGEALLDLGPKRNSVLHARPATIEGHRRLHRWRINPTEIMPISSDYLSELLNEIDTHHQALNRLRPSLR